MPRDQRYCVYCPQVPGQGIRPLDTERHCLTECKVGQDDRTDLYESNASKNPLFMNLNKGDKFKLLVCPTNPSDCKAVSRFLEQQFEQRDKIDRGVVLHRLACKSHSGFGDECAVV